LEDSDSDAVLDVEGAGDGDVELTGFFRIFARFLGRPCGLFAFSCSLRLGTRFRGALNAWRVVDGIVRAVLEVFVKNEFLIEEKFVLW
jgi:hypothetical protein